MSSAVRNTSVQSPAQWSSEYAQISKEANPTQVQLSKLATDYKDTYGNNADPNILQLLQDAASNPGNAASDFSKIDKLAAQEYGQSSPVSSHGDGSVPPSTPMRES